MDIISAFSGLGIAFIIIASLMLYFFINSKAKFIFKMALIPIVLWYSLVILYMPPKMMGWPTTQTPSEESRVISMLIKEPYSGNPGAVYLLLITDKEQKRSIIDLLLNPKYVFEYNEKNIPRFYRIQYDRALHKQLVTAGSKAAAVKGFMKLKFLKNRNKKKPGKDEGGKNKDPDATTTEENRLEIKVIDPRKVLNKGKKYEDKNQ